MKSDKPITGTNPILKLSKINLTRNILTSIDLCFFSRAEGFHLATMYGLGDLLLAFDTLSSGNRRS